MSRAIIEKGEQARFLRAVKEKLGLTWREVAELCRVSEPTIRDWVGERYNMSYEALLGLHRLSGVSLPSHIEVISEEERLHRAGKKTCELLGGNFGTPEGRRKGGERHNELYGCTLTSEARAKGTQEQWRRRREHPERYRPAFGGKHDSTRKEILTPQFSPLLAEMVGILLGDGSIKDTLVEVGLNKANEVEYAEFIAWLFKELFGLEASILPQSGRNVRTVQVCSVALVEYLEGVGLHRGNKVEQQVGIPDWVFSSGDYTVACIRGLMDTDGGSWLRTERRLSPPGHYVTVCFGNHSRPLILGMWKMLKELGYRPRKYQKAVDLNRQEEIRRYYREIGTSNEYHRRRFLELVEQSTAKEWKQGPTPVVRFLGDRFR